MKKLVMLLLCGGMLVACSKTTYNIKISDGNEAIITQGNFKITKQDYFEYLLDSYGGSQVLQDALLSIADQEKLDEEALNQKVEEKKKLFAQYYDNDLSNAAQAYGYDNEEDYINHQIIPACKIELLEENYIKENLDDLLKEYQVCRFKKIIVDKESTALSLIKKATSEDAFDQLMDDDEYKSNAEDADIVTKNSTLDDNLKDQLDELSAVDQDGVYSKAIKLSDDSYAVIYLYDTAKEDKQEYIETLAYDSHVQEEVDGAYLKKYHFTVNDDAIKNQIKEISDQYIE